MDYGVGVSCVNALSSDLRVEVHRDGKIFEQEYKIGVPQYDVREMGELIKKVLLSLFNGSFSEI